MALVSLLLALACSASAPATLQSGLSAPAGAAPAAASAEQDLFARVNAYRVSRGLPALRWSDSVAEQARRHSDEMASGAAGRGHAGFDERLAAIRKRIRISAWAENVVGDRSVDDAFRRLVDSPTHRENLERDFDLTGVGAATDAGGLLYLTQIFVKSKQQDATEPAYLPTVQNGCSAGTNSTGTFLTNPLSHRAHSSIPACSLGMCPITISAFFLRSVAASAT